MCIYSYGGSCISYCELLSEISGRACFNLCWNVRGEFQFIWGQISPQFLGLWDQSWVAFFFFPLKPWLTCRTDAAGQDGGQLPQEDIQQGKVLASILWMFWRPLSRAVESDAGLSACPSDLFRDQDRRLRHVCPERWLPCRGREWSGCSNFQRIKIIQRISFFTSMQLG